MKNLFTAFIEHKEFKTSHPWTVVEQSPSLTLLSPPHYAETVEILLFDNVSGNAYIGGVHYKLCGKSVLYVAPHTVHSFDYSPGNGKILVLKLQPEMLKRFIDTENLLNEYSLSSGALEVYHSNYDSFYPLVKTLKESEDPSTSLCSIISIIGLLVKGTPKNTDLPIRHNYTESTINGIITWTEENCSKRILLDEAAKKFGYTKNYFCDMFKAKTGISYLQYLNTLRVSNACSLLKTGIPVNKVCHMCGFETVSYFIKLFKKTIGMTPKQYQIK